MKILIAVAATLLVAAVIGGATIHSGGLLNFAADEPHPALVEGVIAGARERFIDARAATVEVPSLDDPQLIANGAAHYVPMCAGCHLGPGAEDTEIRRGLYPQPPNLAQPGGHAGHDHGDMQQAARRQFWIIKHGIKMTAMPAWGATHTDEEIWGLVAFVQKLPDMPADEFARLAQGGAGGHDHGGDDGGPHGGHGQSQAKEKHVDPPGAPPHSHGKAAPKEASGNEHAH